MIIYDDEKKILYVPSAGDKIIYDDYEEKAREAYQSGYTAGFEQGVAAAEEECHPDYSKIPLTYQILTDGVMYLYGSYYSPSLEYSKDGGATWNEAIAGGYDGTEIHPFTVVAGDNVMFRGNCTGFNNYYNITSASGASYNLYGNIMSVCYATDFAIRTELTEDIKFQSAFGGYEVGGPINAENLVLPNNVTDRCYRQMFYYAKNLKIGPVLKAQSLNYWCYAFMYEGCRSIEKVTLLATEPDLPESDWWACLNGWLNETNNTGTLVKNANADIPSGLIPSGWTVIDAE